MGLAAISDPRNQPWVAKNLCETGSAHDRRQNFILEFAQPYYGLFRIPSEGIDRVIAALSGESRPA